MYGASFFIERTTNSTLEKLRRGKKELVAFGDDVFFDGYTAEILFFDTLLQWQLAKGTIYFL